MLFFGMVVRRFLWSQQSAKQLALSLHGIVDTVGDWFITGDLVDCKSVGQLGRCRWGNFAIRHLNRQLIGANLDFHRTGFGDAAH